MKREQAALGHVPAVPTCSVCRETFKKKSVYCAGALLKFSFIWLCCLPMAFGFFFFLHFGFAAFINVDKCLERNGM
jgi:hypothetical protein